MFYRILFMTIRKDNKLDAYCEHGQHTVKGWMEPAAAAAITRFADFQRQQGIHGAVGEIGVHHGKLFLLLALLRREDEAAVATDLFSQQHLNVDHSGEGDKSVFLRNLHRHASVNGLVLHEGDSTQLASSDLRRLANGPFRLFSIDGGHTAEITAHDLATAEGALAAGGVLILDDAFNPRWPGVIEGLTQHFQQPRSVQPFAIGGNKVFFTQAEFAPRYTALLDGLDRHAAQQEFLGFPVLCFDYQTPSLGRWWRKADVMRAPRQSYHALRSRLMRH